MTKPKDNVQMHLLIPRELRNEFKGYCSRRGYPMNTVLVNYIRHIVMNNARDKIE